MKNKTMILLALFFSFTAHAADKGLNGGDICEDRFKVVRDDIQSWITDGGSNGLKLPSSLTVAQYNSKMLNMISAAHVSCTDQALTVGDSQKTCENYVDSQGASQISCNRSLFTQTAESDQYVLVHHEYAGLAGIEVNDNDGSKYFVSNQISEYLNDQLVKKLAVKATPSELKNLYRFDSIPENLPSDFNDSLGNLLGGVPSAEGVSLIGMVCDKLFDFKLPVNGVHCMLFIEMYTLGDYVSIITTKVDPTGRLPLSINITVEDTLIDGQLLQNQMNSVNQQIPLYAEFDLTTGKLRYGFDPNQLVLFTP